jgi:hypothetical protein
MMKFLAAAVGVLHQQQKGINKFVGKEHQNGKRGYYQNLIIFF